MSTSSDDLIFDMLGERWSLPGVSARQIIQEGIRSLADEALPILDEQDVAFRIRRALEAHRALSLIRMGDGEALTLAQGRVLSPEEVLARGAFLPHHGVPIPDFAIRDQLVAAVREADLLGIPLSRNPNYQPIFARALAAANVRLSPQRLTHSLVNYTLWKTGVLESLLVGPRVLVVGGPGEALADVLARHGVTVAGVVAPVRGFPDVPSALERCRQFQFDLALVSTGVAACVLCPQISASLGVVALDFGGCADEIVRGEPWHDGPEGDSESAEVLRDAFLAHRTPYPTHIDWRSMHLHGGPERGVTLHTARWEDRWEFHRWSFVVKRALDPAAVDRETRVLSWVGRLGIFEVPEVLGTDQLHLRLTTCSGASLADEGQASWRTVVEALAQFHAGARPLLKRLARDERLRWPVVAARLERLLEDTARARTRLSEGYQEIQAGLASAWERDHWRFTRHRDSTLVHGDLRPNRVTIPSWHGRPPAVVGWEHAGEHLPCVDLVTLLRGRAPADVSRLLEDYAHARTEFGWACTPAAVAEEYTTIARLRLFEELAGGLLQPTPPPLPAMKLDLAVLDGTDDG